MSASITRCTGACPSSISARPITRGTSVDDDSSSGPSISTTHDSALQPATASRSPYQRSRDVTRMRTSQSFRMYATWSLFNSGLTGTNTPPAAAAPKHRDDELDALVEIYREPFGAAEPERGRRAREAFDPARQRRVVERRAGRRQRRRVRVTLGRSGDQLMKKMHAVGGWEVEAGVARRRRQAELTGES